MGLSSIADGAVHNGGVGGVPLAMWGLQQVKSFLIWIEFFVGRLLLLRVRRFITGEDDFLRLGKVYYACFRPLTLPYTDMTQCYVKRLY